MTNSDRYWEQKEVLLEIIDLINEVIPTDISADEQYKFPAVAVGARG